MGVNNVQPSFGLTASRSDIVKRVDAISTEIANDAHVIRGRGAVDAAKAGTLAGQMEQWAVDLARAAELLKGTV